MATTKTSIVMNKDDYWVKVLDKEGFVTVHSDCYYAYSNTKPSDDFRGNFTTLRQITNVTGAKLWIKAISYYLTVVTPNEK